MFDTPSRPRLDATARPSRSLAFPLLLATALCGACGGGAEEQASAALGSEVDHAAHLQTEAAPPAPATPAVGTLEVVAELDRMPSGVAVVGDRVFVSLPRWVEPGAFTVAEVIDGELVAYPDGAANELDAGPGTLHSVNGIHADSRGRLWILDNGRVDLGPAADGAPKIVVIDTTSDSEAFRYVFDPEIAPPGASFLNDIVVDEPYGFAYVTQSGMGGAPSLIAFEIPRDRAWRALDGHASVTPDGADEMVIDGETVMLHRPDGPVVWRVAANAIALDPDGEHLLYGPMTGRVLYRIPTIAVRDELLDDTARGAAVTVAFDKPITDGICTGPDGTVYMTDVENAAVVARTVDGETTTVAADPRMSFPVACEAPGDGWVYFTSNQLHRMPLVLAGEDRRLPPYYLWRVRVE